MPDSIIINTHKSCGEIELPSSKSFLHRYIICASLASGVSVIKKTSHKLSLDNFSTLESLTSLGLIQNSFLFESDINITGGGAVKSGIKLYVRESASALRFLIPIVSSFGAEAFFVCEPSLARRSLCEYEKIYAEKNMTFKRDGNVINVLGKLKSGVYKLRGDISSQFVSGLLFALPLIAGESNIVIECELESKNYVLMTIDIMRKFGVIVDYAENVIKIKGGQKYKAGSFFVEGDFSYAAFFVAGFALGGGGLIKNINQESLQGDKEIIEIAKRMGVRIDAYGNEIRIRRCENLKPIDVDIKNIPDLAPAVALLACAAKGTSKIYNAKRLKLKESDRIECLANAFRNIGAKMETTDDSIIIHGNGKLSGGKTETFNDHRIAMAIAMASNICYNPINLKDYQCVKKSSIEFWEFFHEFVNTSQQTV